MKQDVIEGVEIDHCINCGGVWLDGGELESLTGHSLVAYRELGCPTCHQLLLTRMIGTVEVDYCKKCGGTWLDKGELEGISNIDSKEGGVKLAFNKFKDSVASARNLEIARMGEDIKKKGTGTMLIDDVFIMYKDGLLITCSTKHLSPGIDEDILAGTLVAIQDFVRVSFGRLGDSTLQAIKFGDKQILLERGEHLITAMVVSGDVPEQIRDRLKDVIGNIEKKFGDHLNEWDGNLNDLEGVGEIVNHIFD